MKRRNNSAWAGRMLALLLCAVMLACMAPAYGARSKKAVNGTGSLRVALKSEINAKLAANAKVEFTLYRIGEPAPTTAAGWKINDDLTGYRIIEAKTSEELGKAAAALAKDIGNRYKVATQALKDGAAEFSGLADGVYLGVMTKGPEGLTVTPFIVTLPARNPETKVLQYAYDVTVKAGYTTPSTPKPTTTTNTPGGGGGGTPRPTPVPLVEISGAKVWIDDDNAHNTRPESISIQLLADGTPVDATPTWTKSRGNRWTFTFGKLPEMDDEGNKITYTVSETSVPYYTTSVSGLTITNKLEERPPEKYVELAGRKTWKDYDNAKKKRPSHITVMLLRDGNVVETRTVTVATDWAYDFGRQPADDGYGNEYVYTIREESVKGYFPRVDGMDLTNSLLDGVTPNQPEQPSGGGNNNPPPTSTPPRPVPDRDTGTPIPPFEEMTDEELEELFDVFGYGTPLFGMLGTGDFTPLYPYIFGGAGLLAVVLLVVLSRRKKDRSRGRN